MDQGRKIVEKHSPVAKKHGSTITKHATRVHGHLNEVCWDGRSWDSIDDREVRLAEHCSFASVDSCPTSPRCFAGFHCILECVTRMSYLKHPKIHSALPKTPLKTLKTSSRKLLSDCFPASEVGKVFATQKASARPDGPLKGYDFTTLKKTSPRGW